jgi:type I restriction enzyme S subunit
MEIRRFWDGTIPWVTPKDMKRVAIDDSIIKVTNAALVETSLRLIEPPAVLMVVRGMILSRKVPVAYINSPVTINQDMKALKAAKGIDAEFLACFLDTAQEAFIPLIDEAGHGTRRLPTERWRNLAIAVPPEAEQISIMRFLYNTIRPISVIIDRTQREISLLQEYRTRLIADVVTGKLDVREAAARLPEEGDEIEVVDEAEVLEDVDEEMADDLEAVSEEAEG